MAESKDLFNESYLRSMFEDCIDVGADFRKKNDTYAVMFPTTGDRDGYYFSFSLLDDDTVAMFSNVSSFEGQLKLDDFLGGLDVISAKLLTMFDDEDRGV